MTHLTIQQLVAQTDGELTGPSLTLVEKHIAECETCWQEMERLAELDALLASVITVDPGDAFFEDLEASVTAEISGKKKPAPRVAARPAPAAAPAPAAPQSSWSVAARPAPATPSAEPEAAPPAFAMPVEEPAATIPAPVVEEHEVTAPASVPVADLDTPPASAPAPESIEPGTSWAPPAPPAADAMTIEPGASWTPPGQLTTEPVGGWTPPAPTPDDPFADLGLPSRPAASPAPRPAPTPDDPFADLVPPSRSTVAPPPIAKALAPPSIAKAPAPRPVPTAPPAPIVVKPAPGPARPPAPIVVKPAPRPTRPLAPIVVKPAPMATPQPQAEPASPHETGRQSVAVPILIGIVAFIAGLAVAVVVVLRLVGPGGILKPARPEPGASATALTIGAPPVTPAVEPPAVPVVEPLPEPAVVAPPVESTPAPPAHATARPRRHAPSAASNAADNAALAASPTIVVPVRVIRSETMAPVSPTSAPSAPAAPAPSSELGILCGAVRDSDGHPVARAQVMMADVGVVVLTDRSGRFCLTAPVGERTLSVAALGFTSSRRLVSLNKRTPELNLTLKSAAPFPTPH